MSDPAPAVRTTAPGVDLVPPLPGWRYRMVWFMLALPASAVVAATASAVIAFRQADVVLDETPTATSLAAHAMRARH